MSFVLVVTYYQTTVITGACMMEDGNQEAFLEIIHQVVKLLGRPGRGSDTNDTNYPSLLAMWKHEGLVKAKKVKAKAKATAPEEGSTSVTADQPSKPLPWYAEAFAYWESEANCPATVDGVLGGYGVISPTDITTSKRFLDRLMERQKPPQRTRALDCGAGIGRVSKSLLLPYFEEVDLLEQSPRLLAAAPQYIGEDAKRARFFDKGMQDFRPEPGTYDVVWIQWCIGHLHDLDLVHFLQRLRGSLRPGGLIVIKDNCCEDVDFVVDKADSSVTRSSEYLQAVVRVAGLSILEVERTQGFPTDLFPVMMIAAQ